MTPNKPWQFSELPIKREKSRTKSRRKACDLQNSLNTNTINSCLIISLRKSFHVLDDAWNNAKGTRLLNFGLQAEHKFLTFLSKSSSHHVHQKQQIKRFWGIGRS